MSSHSFPPHMGMSFTPTTHEHASGPTLPENNRPPPGHPFHVLVTGAGKGLGYAISIAYARAGTTHICISSRTQSDLDKLSAELRSINPSITILSRLCDTTDPKQVAALADAVRTQWFCQLDVVIANAGVISKYLVDSPHPHTGAVQPRRLPIGIVEDDDFARVTTINYLGSYHVAKYFTPILLDKANRSAVRAYIVITSLAGHFARSDFTPVAYNVSKIAVMRMVECMSADHGAEGLVAFAVHPGEVVTPQTVGHSTAAGDMWDALLQTDIGLAGGFCTWLTREKREWLSGRYLSVHWDVDELEGKKEEIVTEDKLKFRMVV